MKLRAIVEACHLVLSNDRGCKACPPEAEMIFLQAPCDDIGNLAAVWEVSRRVFGSRVRHKAEGLGRLADALAVEVER